jgi:hypothetical protein
MAKEADLRPTREWGGRWATALPVGRIYLDGRGYGGLRGLGIEEAGCAKTVEPGEFFGPSPGARSVDFPDQPVDEAAVAGDVFRSRNASGTLSVLQAAQSKDTEAETGQNSICDATPSGG